MKIPLLTHYAPLLLSYLLPEEAPQTTTTVTFGARHAFAQGSSPLARANNAPALLLQDAGSSAASLFAADDAEADEPLTLRTRRTVIRRAKHRAPHMLSWAKAAKAQRLGLQQAANYTGWSAPSFTPDDDTWEDVEIDAPDMTDRQTVLALAKLAANAYSVPQSDGWYELPGYNATVPFGWAPDDDGLRGHVFADETNSTVIIAIKGTSAGVLGSGGPTSKNDKFNDNLMFSCCCARVDFSWSTVCDCHAGGYKCKQSCLEDALIEESVYATVGTNLYNNVTYLYPNANIWLTGHSLGGGLAALIGNAFGAPAVGFEAPGDRLPSRRLHLPGPPAISPELSGITHVYHTADPIPMGACTGTYSGCYAAGFALESKCHVGQTILYDTVTVKGWSVDIRTHRISEVITKVLTDPWPVGDEGWDGEDEDEEEDGWLAWWGWGRKGKKDKDKDGGKDKHGGVPKARPDFDCVDCYKWEFADSFD